MLGDLIANLDRPDVAGAVLATLDPVVAARIERHAAAAAMIAPDFIAGAVREFVERADDELWLQLLTIMRKAMGERWYRQEYGCEFSETADGVFARDDVERAISREFAPLVIT